MTVNKSTSPISDLLTNPLPTEERQQIGTTLHHQTIDREKDATSWLFVTNISFRPYNLITLDYSITTRWLLLVYFWWQLIELNQSLACVPSTSWYRTKAQKIQYISTPMTAFLINQRARHLMSQCFFNNTLGSRRETAVWIHLYKSQGSSVLSNWRRWRSILSHLYSTHIDWWYILELQVYMDKLSA